MISVYLAGPEVFHANAVQLGMAKKLLCARFHYYGLYPLDDPPAGRPTDGAAIYAGCMAMIQRADCGIFNLTPFRGPSADAGTVFELGVMAALGKPVFAYTHVGEDLIDRLRAYPGLTFDEATKRWRDPLGMSAEDFGNAENLMLDEALATQNLKIHRHPLPEAERFTRLDGFVACLADVRARFDAVRYGESPRTMQ